VIKKEPKTASAKDMTKELQKNSTKPMEEASVNDADASPEVSAQIVKQENSALSREQLKYLKANEAEKSPSTRKAVIERALTDRTAELTKAQQARVALASKVAEATKNAADAKLSQEMQAKKLFETEMRATDGKVNFALEHNSKAAWKSSESSAKSEESKKESTQKESQEDEAEKARLKTSKDLSQTAQDELRLPMPSRKCKVARDCTKTLSSIINNLMKRPLRGSRSFGVKSRRLQS
jgi:hypothetical protein